MQIFTYMENLISFIEDDLKNSHTNSFPNFKSGDTINVHLKIIEGDKQRIQQFKGIVIQRKNPNTMGETFTVRKITNNIGVERIIPICSPNIEKIEVLKKGKTRRARIYFLRGKYGKNARIKEKQVSKKVIG